MTIIIDSTGTMLAADSCYLVPDEAFTEDEWEDIENFSDSEIARIGKENGVSVAKSEQLLQAIADALWGDGADASWSPDTIQAIADAIYSERPDLPACRLPGPGPTYDVWIAEPDAWAWQSCGMAFTCDDDPDGRGARAAAHDHARYLRRTYPCAFVAVRPAAKGLPPLSIRLAP